MYKEIINLIQKINKGDLVYDDEEALIGYFTGLCTYSGYIECENCNGNTYFVYGLATYTEGFGLKLNKDYKII